MTTIVLVSRNLGKFSEIRNLLPDSFILKNLDEIGCKEEIAETGITFQENALIKARYVYEMYHLNCLSDDSGLEVAALNGAPGVFSARYAGNNATDSTNVLKLLQELGNSLNRKARFKTVLALILDGKEHIFDGTVEGEIAFKPSGSGGFGYDPVFIPDGFDATFSELSIDVKNNISHRGIAVRKMLKFLAER